MQICGICGKETSISIPYLPTLYGGVKYACPICAIKYVSSECTNTEFGFVYLLNSDVEKVMENHE